MNTIRSKIFVKLAGQIVYIAGKFYVMNSMGRWQPKMQTCQTKTPRKKT